MAWHYRKSLARYARGMASHTQTILDIDPMTLKQQGIEGLILDFDGVLGPHAALKPLASVEAWLLKALAVFEPNYLFILSNKPSASRIAYFKTHFPGIAFVQPKRKKPFIEGIQMILDQLGVAPQKVVLLDDRLLTGILASLIAGIQACYVQNPWVDFRSRPFSESGYYWLRAAERTVLACLF